MRILRFIMYLIFLVLFSIEIILIIPMIYTLESMFSETQLNRILSKSVNDEMIMKLKNNSMNILQENYGLDIPYQYKKDIVNDSITQENKYEIISEFSRKFTKWMLNSKTNQDISIVNGYKGEWNNSKVELPQELTVIKIDRNNGIYYFLNNTRNYLLVSSVTMLLLILITVFIAVSVYPFKKIYSLLFISFLSVINVLISTVGLFFSSGLMKGLALSISDKYTSQIRLLMGANYWGYDTIEVFNSIFESFGINYAKSVFYLGWKYILIMSMIFFVVVCITGINLLRNYNKKTV